MPNDTTSTRILVVDDDPIQLQFAHYYLGVSGAKITTTISPQNALITAESQTFDAIITDLEMPEMTGLELIAAFRKSMRYLRTPIILVTSKEDLAAINEAYRLGVNDFALKPVNWGTLSLQIKKALGY